MPAAAMRVRQPRWACTCLLAILLTPPLFAQTGDQDLDGLPDDWEIQFGLNPALADGDDGAAGDPDGDGQSNAVEYAARSHPRGRYSRVVCRRRDGRLLRRPVRALQCEPDGIGPGALPLLPGRRCRCLEAAHWSRRWAARRSTPKTLDGIERTAFATVVEADQVVVVDRTMNWDGTHYGSHAETGTPGRPRRGTSPRARRTRASTCSTCCRTRARQTANVDGHVPAAQRRRPS